MKVGVGHRWGTAGIRRQARGRCGPDHTASRQAGGVDRLRRLEQIDQATLDTSVRDKLKGVGGLPNRHPAQAKTVAAGCCIQSLVLAVPVGGTAALTSMPRCGSLSQRGRPSPPRHPPRYPGKVRDLEGCRLSPALTNTILVRSPTSALMSSTSRVIATAEARTPFTAVESGSPSR